MNIKNYRLPQVALRYLRSGHCDKRSAGWTWTIIILCQHFSRKYFVNGVISECQLRSQWDQIRRNFATLDNFLKAFGNLFSISQRFEPTLANCIPLGNLSLFVNGQRLKNNRAIWTHCLWPKWDNILPFFHRSRLGRST